MHRLSAHSIKMKSRKAKEAIEIERGWMTKRKKGRDD